MTRNTDSTISTSNVQTGNATFVLPPNDKYEQGIEFETRIEWFQIEMQCPECEIGWIKGTGEGITTNKTLWINKCNNCSHKAWYDFSYPYQVFKPVGKKHRLSPDSL